MNRDLAKAILHPEAEAFINKIVKEKEELSAKLDVETLFHADIVRENTKIQSKLEENEFISGKLREQRNIAEDKVKELTAQLTNYKRALNIAERFAELSGHGNLHRERIETLARDIDREINKEV